MKSRRRSSGYIPVFVAFVWFLSGCEKANYEFNPKHFDVDARATLCFDLDDSQNSLGAGVVLKLLEDARGHTTFVLVPFASKSARVAEADSLVMWGTQANLTGVAYTPVTRSALSVAIGLEPSYAIGADGDFRSSELPAVLTLVSDGLKRRFVFKPSQGQNAYAEELGKKLSALPLDEVAVRIPADAEIFESPSATVPRSRQKQVANAPVRFYPYASVSQVANAGLDIRYQIPPTKEQKTFVEYGVKLFAYLVSPLVGLTLIKTGKVAKPRARRILIRSILAFQALLLAALLGWSWHVRSALGLGSLLEVGLALAGAAVTWATSSIKGEAEAA